MDLILFFKAVVMGIVEGLTEFLPISSTGHLILAGDLLGLNGESAKVFKVVIQTGAIFAILWEYRARFLKVLAGLFSDANQQRFAVNVAIAFLPAAVLGVLFGKVIKAHLFQPVTVACAFIVGGLLILWAEKRKHKIRIRDVDQMSWTDALKVGCAQCLALIPGTSRSGATIIGGLLFGLSRKAATEFSFFLAVPTIMGAGVYELYSARKLLSVADTGWFLVGAVTAALAAFLCVRWLLRYISAHDFSAFAWYRIVFGLIVLLTAYTGMVSWTGE